MTVPKVVLVTLVLALLTLETAGSQNTPQHGIDGDDAPGPGKKVLLEKRGVVENLINDVVELAERVPEEELDDLMNDVEAIEKRIPKEVLDDLVKKVEELQMRL